MHFLAFVAITIRKIFSSYICIFQPKLSMKYLFKSFVHQALAIATSSLGFIYYIINTSTTTSATSTSTWYHLLHQLQPQMTKMNKYSLTNMSITIFIILSMEIYPSTLSFSGRNIHEMKIFWQKERCDQNNFDNFSSSDFHRYIFLFQIGEADKSEKVWGQKKKLWSLVLFVCLRHHFMPFLETEDWIMNSWN